MTKNYSRFFCIAFVLFIFWNDRTFGQLVINELCPTNITINQNSNGDYDDWIELYNSGASALNLSGYGLTDDPLKPFDFKFPSYTLNAGQRVLVFASGKSNEVIAHHWEMGVDAATSWKYIAGSAAVDTNWRNTSFTPPGTWGNGAGSIGFGDADDATTISIGSSVYMRKVFSIPDTAQILKAVLMMDYDDGFVAYLNGVEIARANLGTEGFRPLWNELALSSHEAQKYQGLPLDSFFIKRSLFKSIIRPGNNVLAIEVHNAPANSNDMTSLPYLFFGMMSSGSTFSSIPSWFLVPPVEYYNANFKLARTGETIYLYNPAGSLADSKIFPAMLSDNSLGRKPDGSGSWCFFATPTPSTSNNSSTCYNGYASTPVFSKPPGFYNGTQLLTLSQSTPGGVIRYTTNGNTPTASSPSYSSPISISSTKTIRARVFASGYLPSEVVTNDYILDASSKLSTICITTDSLNLWDYNTGIYVMGPGAASTSPYKGANFWMDWTKPASIEYFDKNKNLIVDFDADIKIYGNYSRAKPQKSFLIKLSDKYGTGEFDYPIYPDKPYIHKIDNILVRNAGTDWNVVHFRDEYMQRMMKNTYSGYLASEPTVAYLNGEYWGVYHINEKKGDEYIQSNFGFDDDQMHLLEEHGSTIDILRGEDVSFWSLYNYATSTSPTSAAYYDYIDQYLDLKNYTDYFAAETFYDNGDWIGDWTNNIEMWRAKKPGSKWKYLLWDLDFGLGLQGSVSDDRLKMARNPAAFSYSSEMFDAILKNPTYKRYFINRYCDLLNTIWLPGNMDDYMHSYKDTMSFDMTEHFAKWGSNSSTWNSNINSMMNFANARPNKMRDFIKSQFGLGTKVTLTLQSSPAGAGRIEISTITPTSLPWSGVYFNGNTVTITAIPNPGFTFDHFHSSNTITTNNFNQSVTYNYTNNDQITAFFTGSAQAAKVCISELNYNSNSQNDAGDWIELHNYATYPLNISGWKLMDSNDNHSYVLPTGTVIPANGYLVLCEDTEKFQFQFPNVTNVIGPIGFNFSNAGDQVRLYNYASSLYLSFTFEDLAPWPLQADGLGYTCELSANTANPNDGNSWFPGCIGGSPGVAYSPLLSTPVSISGSTTFCSGGNVSLHATSGSGFNYQWLNNNVNIPGATDSVFVATQTGNYSVRVASQGCTTVTTATAVSVVSQQPDPVTTGAERCGAGDVTLTAIASDTVFWYDAPSGGNLLGTGNSLFIPYLSQTQNYYAVTGSNCSSSPVSTPATILDPASPPVASNVSRCGPGSVTLTATDTAAMRWYNAPVGGGLVETGGTFVTNILFNDTIFYVEAGVCSSFRTQVNVTVNITPDPVTFDGSRCGPGTVTLNATSPYAVAWYTAKTSGTLVGNGSSFTTGSIAATDTFYAEANGGCPSERIMTIAMVNSIPTPPTASDVPLCSPGTADLSATATEQIDWFDVPSGGSSLFTGSNFTTPFLTSPTTYYVQTGYICSSLRIPVQVLVGAAPAPPSGSDINRCGTGSVMLNANSPEAIFWYDQPTGGTLLVASDNYQTPAISVTTTYYAEAGNACRSSRTPIKAIVDPVPSAPNANDVSRCGTGSLTLTASSPETVYWYSAPTGGTLLHTGSAYTTPSISNTTTYYVEAGDNCISNRIPVQAIVANQPANPVVTGDSTCGPGTVTLQASSPESLSWFNSPSGGSPIGSGTSFTTPSISATTTYYVQAYNGCSTSRVPVVAKYNAIPAPPVANDVQQCGSSSVTLTASSPQQIYWYSAASGGTLLGTGSSFTTPLISVTTTYYVEAGNICKSSREQVIAIIVNNYSAPVLTGTPSCGPGTVLLSAATQGTVKWYGQAQGGPSLGTGQTYTTPFLTSTTTYWAEANSGNCHSPRVSVQALVSTQPNDPVTNDVSRCGTGTVTLTASSSATVNWYTSPSGGSTIGSGLSFITPTISSTTTYYAEAFNGCTSNRVSTIAEVDPVPAPPISSNETRCGNGSLTLNATSPETIKWYTVSTGGSNIFTGANFVTPSLSTTTTYYVGAGDICRSTRTQVIASIVPIPSTPSGNNASRCGTGSVTLTATSSATLTWYANSSGGASIGSGATYVTPSLSNTTTYYLEAANGTCISTSRDAVVATINSIPSLPAVTNNSRCGTGTVVLSASSPAPVKWYTTPTGGSSIGSGANFTTPSISVTSTYYAEANDGCVSQRAMVIASVDQVPSPPATSNVSRCDPGTVTLTATSPEQIYWYTSGSGGSAVSTGASYTTPSISTTTTYYVETGNNCRSTRIPVQAIINVVPASPALTAGTRCGQGTVDLTAHSSALVRWFDSPSSSSSIGAGLLFTTPVITTTTTYYAEAGVAGCASSRVPVLATVNPFAASPTTINNSRCGSGHVTLSANGVGQLYWYSTLSSSTILDSGTTYTTPTINSTKTYYVQTTNGTCPSARTSVQAIINPIPSPPSVSDASRCSSGSVTLAASSSSPIYWFDAQTNGTQVGTGSTFTTPSLSSSTTYWVETGSTCRSSRIAVHALIVTAPNPPVLNDTSICGQGNVVLEASSPARVNWFSVPTGGAVLDTGLYFNTAFLTSTTTYFAEAGFGCNSARVPVVVTVETIPAAPTAVDSSRCDPGTLALHASGSQNLYWYDLPAGGAVLHSGATFITPSISSTTIFYVETGDVCRSSRIPVQAIILPSPILSTSDGFTCGVGSVLMSVMASVPADSVMWYDSPGGTLLGTGFAFSSPVLTANTTYYVEAHGICPAIPLPMNAFVFPAISVNIGPDTLLVSSGQLVNLNAGAGYASYYWSTGDSVASIQVSTQGVYSVMATDNNGCTATDQIYISVVTTVNQVNSQPDVLVYPNPTHDKISVLLPDQKQKNLTLKLISVDGKIVIREEIKSNGSGFYKTISVKDLAEGIYFLTLENSGYFSSTRIVVE